jgi:CheY-like chemotaxis protein
MSEQPVILVVDDTPLMRHATACTVRAFGYEIKEAASGEAALQMLATESYDAIFMDLRMPRMDGLECTQKIREAEAKSGTRVPIIALTSESDADIQRHCLEAGMDAFLHKSCSQQDMKVTLTKFLKT